MSEASESPAPVDENLERRTAWWLVLIVLAVLTAVKPLGGIAVVGTIGFTFAAILQLYLPLWRAGKLDRDYDWVGLHMQTWRRDLKIVGILCAISFPPFVIGHHIYMTQAHGWLVTFGFDQWAAFVPRRELDLSTPVDLAAWGLAAWWLLKISATHSLGVALPEETFYRGYLQPRLESLWKPKFKLFGVPIGKAALVAAALFAIGHFLGEWNPLRLGPFFPALVFAWQRNATGSIFGAITFHALCNILGEVLFSFYKPL